MSDKPVYQAIINGKYEDVSEKRCAELKATRAMTRILYPASVVEALKAENEEQAKRIAELETPLTHRQISSACLSFRHDFGLLEPEQQATLFSEAKSWEACFQKERDITASKNGDSK